MRTLVCISWIAAAAASCPTNAQDSLQLGEGVTWASSARHADPPDLVDIDGLTPPTQTDDLVILYRRIDFRISQDSVTRSSINAYQYNSMEAARNHGTLRIAFDAGKDEIEIRAAMVLDSRGIAHVVDPDTVQVLPSDTFDIFSDTKLVLLPLTGIDVGSVAIVAETTTTARELDIAPWGTFVYEQLSVPQGRLEISVAWDTPELRPRWHSELDEMHCVEADTGSVSCGVTDVAAYPLDPDVFYDDETPQFVAAEDSTWQEIGAWYATIFDSALTHDRSVLEKAVELGEGLEDEADILESVHEFVSNQVRYVGLEHGESAYVPYASDVTLRRRYGDCKDKSALLVDLLRAHGIEMSPVLVATSRRDPGKLAVPSARYFDHLVVCGALGDGREYCLDATDPYGGIKQLSGWIQGAVTLNVADASGPGTLPADPYRFALRETLRLRVRESGALEETGTVIYEGAYGAQIRGHLAALNADDRHQWAVDDYQSTVSSLVQPEFRFDGIDETEPGLTVGWDVTYENLFPTDDYLTYFEDAAWLDQTVNLLRSENDHYDYRFPGLRFESVANVEVSSHWSVDYVSPEINMQSRFGRLQRMTETDGNSVVIRTLLEAPAAQIPTDEIEEFDRFLQAIVTEDEWRVQGELRSRR